MKAAPLPSQMYTTFCCCWPCGVVGDLPASSKRSGKSTGLTSAAHAAGACSPKRRALAVKAEPLADAAARRETIGIGFQMDLLVLQTAPQPLDELRSLTSD